MKKFLFCLLFLAPTFLNAKTAVYFTPSSDCENHIVALIDKAKSSVDIAVYSLTNTKIAKALLNAKLRGIRIRVLTDKLQAYNKNSKALFLYESGLDIKLHSVYKIEHNKFMIVDNGVLETGSYNYTEAATYKNSENCLFLWDEKETISKYKNRFEYLWAINGQANSDSFFKKIKEK